MRDWQFGSGWAPTVSGLEKIGKLETLRDMDELEGAGVAFGDLVPGWCLGTVCRTRALQVSTCRGIESVGKILDLSLGATTGPRCPGRAQSLLCMTSRSCVYQDEELRRRALQLGVPCRRLSLVVSFRQPPTSNSANDEQSEHSSVSPRSLLVVRQLLTLHPKYSCYNQSWRKRPGKYYLKLIVDEDVKKTAVAERGNTPSWTEPIYLYVEFQCCCLHAILNPRLAMTCMGMFTPPVAKMRFY
jgi:hypothetical protein